MESATPPPRGRTEPAQRLRLGIPAVEATCVGVPGAAAPEWEMRSQLSSHGRGEVKSRDLEEARMEARNTEVTALRLLGKLA